MPTININVNGKIATAEQGCVVDNNLDYTVVFTFSEEWDGMDKTMRVNYGGEHKEVDIVDDMAQLPGIPYGVRIIAIGAYGEDIATTSAAYLPVMPSIKDDMPEDEPDDPGTGGVPEGGAPGQYMTRDINGGLEWIDLPKASGTKTGGVRADVATINDTQPVRIGADGKLYTSPGGSGIPAGGTGGQVLTKVSATDYDAEWITLPVYVLPVASQNQLGGVQPTAKESTMTQPVGIDVGGALWTEPPTAELPSVTAADNGAVLQAVNGAWATGLKLWVGTQAQYDAIVTKDNGTLYIILEATT